MTICKAPAVVHASTAEAIIRQVSLRTGWLKLAMLIGWFIGARLVAKGPALGRKILLGLVIVTFLVSQGISMVDTYRTTQLYQPRRIMTLSDLQIVENVYHSREFSGRNVLPLLVADYMPHTRVFIYDANLFSKELLGWSGRDPDSTFFVGGYQPAIDPAFKAACLQRDHAIYKGRSEAPLYVALPLSTYSSEDQVFLMHDESIDYLIPGSWGIPRHE
jgi:hypothetical protein